VREGGVYKPAFLSIDIDIEKILAQSKSWAEFKAHLQTLSSKEKGDAFEHLTKLYLELDPTYATKLRAVWLLREVPAHVREHLNLPTTDQGIDLIAETVEG
jgi:predicted helicase